MDRLREAFARLAPWQRNTLAGMVVLVVVAVLLLVVLAVGGPPAPEAPPDTTTVTTTSTTLAETTTTTLPTTTTTTAASTSTGAETTTTTSAAEAELVLRPDGLGDVRFGLGAEEAVAGLSELLGSPDDDTGWRKAVGPFATCIGEEVQFVTWASVRIFLTDGATDWAPAGVRHFASYGHGLEVGEPLLGLRTAEGVGVGTPVGDVRAIYGEDAVTDDPLVGPWFRVDFPGAGYLAGQLSGTRAIDVVESIGAGDSCGE